MNNFIKFNFKVIISYNLIFNKYKFKTFILININIKFI